MIWCEPQQPLYVLSLHSMRTFIMNKKNQSIAFNLILMKHLLNRCHAQMLTLLIIIELHKCSVKSNWQSCFIHAAHIICRRKSFSRIEIELMSWNWPIWRNKWEWFPHGSSNTHIESFWVWHRVQLAHFYKLKNENVTDAILFQVEVFALHGAKNQNCRQCAVHRLSLSQT